MGPQRGADGKPVCDLRHRRCAYSRGSAWKTSAFRHWKSSCVVTRSHRRVDWHCRRSPDGRGAGRASRRSAGGDRALQRGVSRCVPFVRVSRCGRDREHVAVQARNRRRVLRTPRSFRATRALHPLWPISARGWRLTSRASRSRRRPDFRCHARVSMGRCHCCCSRLSARRESLARPGKSHCPNTCATPACPRVPSRGCSPACSRSRRSIPCGRTAPRSAAGSRCRRARDRCSETRCMGLPRGTRLWKEFSAAAGWRRASSSASGRLRGAMRVYVWNEAGRTRCSHPPMAWQPSRARAVGVIRFPRKPIAARAMKARLCPYLDSVRFSFRPTAIRPRRMRSRRTAWICGRSPRAAGWHLPAACSRSRRASPLRRPWSAPHSVICTGTAATATANPTTPARRCRRRRPRAVAQASQTGRDGVRSLVGVSSRFRESARSAAQLVAPGASHASVLALRMRSRDPLVADAAARYRRSRFRSPGAHRALDRN